MRAVLRCLSSIFPNLVFLIFCEVKLLSLCWLIFGNLSQKRRGEKEGRPVCLPLNRYKNIFMINICGSKLQEPTCMGAEQMSGYQIKLLLVIVSSARGFSVMTYFVFIRIENGKTHFSLFLLCPQGAHKQLINTAQKHLHCYSRSYTAQDGKVSNVIHMTWKLTKVCFIPLSLSQLWLAIWTILAAWMPRSSTSSRLLCAPK